MLSSSQSDCTSTFGEAALTKWLTNDSRVAAARARFVAMCLREWRAADALYQLAEDASGPGDGVGVGVADRDWLGLCCGAHLRKGGAGERYVMVRGG
mgnify:CR=1 FL=1